MEVVTEREKLPLAMEDGLRIEAAAWKGEAGTAIANDEQVKCFYGRIAERAADNATLRLLFLTVGKKRIACAYCLRRGSTLYLLKSGYDPAYSPYSPFNALLLLAVEAAYRDGQRVIDLLGDEVPWKHDWTNEAVGRHWLFLFRDTLRARLVYYVKFVILPVLKRLHVLAPTDQGHSFSPHTSKLGRARS